jgi:hypothetical protein
MMAGLGLETVEVVGGTPPPAVETRSFELAAPAGVVAGGPDTCTVKTLGATVVAAGVAVVATRELDGVPGEGSVAATAAVPDGAAVLVAPVETGACGLP